jgi:hypothetical protein
MTDADLNARMTSFFAAQDAQNHASWVTLLQNAVAMADATTMLGLMEAAGNQAVGLTNIRNALGFGAGQLDAYLVQVLNSLIYDRLVSLRPIAQAKYYNFYL